MNFHKCAIIGCGAVGAAVAYTLVRSELFDQLIILDRDEKRARGEATDISHSIPYARPTETCAGSYPDLADCGLIVIAAGAGQTPGETRMDLLRKNAAVLKSIIPQIVQYNREAVLLIVTNPVDVLTHLAWKLSGFPKGRVIGSGTTLDTARLKLLLGRYLDVDPRNVHAFIIGEHGDTELPVWSSANVSGINLHDFCRLCGKSDDPAFFEELFSEVKNSAYQIIEDKGATCYGIATAVQRIVEAVVRDERAILPVSTVTDHVFGTEVAVGMPSVVGSAGVLHTLELPLDDRERTALQASVAALREAIDELPPL